MLQPRLKKTFQYQFAAIVALAAIIFLLTVLSRYPLLIERYFSEGLYPFICRLLHPLLNFFPFSIGDLLYIAVICFFIYALYCLTRLLFKKQFYNALVLALRLIIRIQAAFIVFYFFWGLNYFRMPAAVRLNLRDTSYTTANLKAVTATLIDSANAIRATITPADLSQSNGAIYQTAVQAIKKLSNQSVQYRTYSPDIKPSLLTIFLNYMGTSGYYNPFTGEAQINYEMPVVGRPVVACHEMSHQMGFAAEDEADFVGFVAGTGSHDRLLRYSAYRLAVGEFMQALYYSDSLANKELKRKISAAVLNDFKAERTYWAFYEGRANILSSVFFDKFLKANNQPHGLNTYNRMVLLVMALYGKKTIDHRP